MAANNKRNRKENTVESTWNTIRGIMRVYTNELEGRNGKPWYKSSVSIASKDEKGEYHRFYIDLKFPKDLQGLEGAGVHNIDVAEAFLTTEYWYDSKSKEERVKPVLLVLEYEEIG